MKSQTIEWARKQKFSPGLLGVFINPFFLARRALRREIAALAPLCSGPVIDIGCGSMPYRALMPSPYMGVEIDNPETRKAGHADAFYDGKKLPFAEESFETAMCNQVMEHVFEPDEFLAEICRVLRPGGRLLLTVPFVWDEHEQPHDFARYSSFGLEALLERNGFKVVFHRKTLTDLGIIGQLLNAYFYKVLWSRHTIINILILLFLLAPISVVFSILRKILPRNADLYLDNIVLAEKSMA